MLTRKGFLRTETSLIQTIGRAARNAEGHVIMYADNITDSMDKALTETNRRRKIQQNTIMSTALLQQLLRRLFETLLAFPKKWTERLATLRRS